MTTYCERTRQGVWDVRAAFLPQQYFEAVTSCGAAAVLLPPQPAAESTAEAVLAGLDGLVLTGGVDVQPELYGAQRHPQTDAARADRDAWELALLRGAGRRGIPVFGICRGLQLINVAYGGTLHQHLPDALRTERYRAGRGVFTTNTVHVDEGTRLAGILGGGGFDVHSYHHQGIDVVGDGLKVTARSDDGLVQAVELPGEEYLVAVQWHPEENLSDLRLFGALVDAASAHRAARQEAHA